MQLLTAKPASTSRTWTRRSLANLDGNNHYAALKRARRRRARAVVPICAALEAQIAELDPADRPDFLASAGLKEPGLHASCARASSSSGCMTFFTAGKDGGPRLDHAEGGARPAGRGVIHTDFEKGFIKAEVIWWEDFVKLGGEAKCRDAGKLAIEGKEYVVRDGDVVHFRFNV